MFGAEINVVADGGCGRAACSPSRRPGAIGAATPTRPKRRRWTNRWSSTSTSSAEPCRAARAHHTRCGKNGCGHFLCLLRRQSSRRRARSAPAGSAARRTHHRSWMAWATRPTACPSRWIIRPRLPCRTPTPPSGRRAWAATSSSALANPCPPSSVRRRRLTIGTQQLDDPDPLVLLLRELAMARHTGRRSRSTLRPLDCSPDRSRKRQLHTRWAPRFQFGRSALHHLVTSNAVDLTEGSPRWPVLDLAIARGAVAVDDGRGDVQLPDGTRGMARRRADPIPLPDRRRPGAPPRSPSNTARCTPFGGNATVADLAPDQLAAVTHDGGAARIIAPAGSGKTRVLTERARHLLHQWRLPPSAVCLVAFNKRAQQEMVERTRDLPWVAGAHTQRHRPRHRQRQRAVRRATAPADHHRRGRGSPDHRSSGQVPAQAQRRSGRHLDRGAVTGAAGSEVTCRRRADVRRRGRRLRRRAARGTGASSSEPARSTSTNRSSARSRSCCPTRSRGRPPSARAG